MKWEKMVKEEIKSCGEEIERVEESRKQIEDRNENS